MEKKFPATLYVKQEEDGDSHYFVAETDERDLADMTESVVVGVYKLTEVAEISVSVSRNKRKRK